MKQVSLLAAMLIIANAVLSQNVGIGETNPPVKLTVKGTGLQSSLLVKNSNDDSVILSGYRNIHLGGYHASSTGVVSISNKNFLPFDPSQLDLVAAGERSGFDVNGSMSSMKFSNINSNKNFFINSYVGNSMPNQQLSISYFDPNDGTSSYRTLLFFNPDGRTGIGTYEPTGRLQINHTSSTGSPTLNLLDSSVNFMPVIQFGNRGGSDYWQMRGSIVSGAPANTFLDFATQANIRMTLRGDGNLGIGNSNPSERLDVSGNVRVTGEVNRTPTGAANLVPICYGVITAAGGIQSGSGNFSVNHLSTGLYDITITDELYHFALYTTIVTPVSSITPVVASTSSGSNRLQIYLHNLAGADVDAIFGFVVYQQ